MCCEIELWNVDQNCHKLQFWGRHSMPRRDMADPTYGEIFEGQICQSVAIFQFAPVWNCAKVSTFDGPFNDQP